MICNNCKNNIPDDSTFCPVCGGGIEIKTKKNKPSVNKLFLILSIVIAALLIAFGVIVGVGISRLNKLAEIQPELVADLNMDGHFSLILYADDTMLYKGEEKNIIFTVRVYNDFPEPGREVSILDKDKKVIGTVPIELDEEAEYTEISFGAGYIPEDDNGPVFYASMNDIVSEPLQFYVVEHLSVEQLFECVQVGEELKAWVNEKKLEEDYLAGKKQEEDVLSLVYDWLKNDERVGYVEKGAVNIFYSTVGHVAGMYELPGDGTCYGGASDIQSRDFAQEDDMSIAMKNEDRSGSIYKDGEEFLYIDGINSITNKNYLILDPAKNGGDGIVKAGIANFRDMGKEYVNELDYNGYECADRQAFETILGGDIIEYGIVNLICHGGYWEKDGNFINYYKCFKVNEKERATTIADVNTLFEGVTGIDSVQGLMDGFYCDTKPEKSLYFFDGDTIYFSSNALNMVYQNKFFDNSVIYIGTCYGLIDDRLPSMFISHKVKYLIGWQASAQSDVENHTFESIFSELKKGGKNGTPALEDLSNLNKRNFVGVWNTAWQRPADMGAEVVSSFGGEKAFLYDPAKQGPKAKLFTDQPKYRLWETGKISGSVDRKTVYYTVDINGTVIEEEQFEAAEKVKVELQRFENQSFLSHNESAPSVVTNGSGAFNIKDLRWGAYGIILSGDDILKDYASVVLADKAFEGENAITVRGKGAEITAEVHIMDAGFKAPADATAKWLKENTEAAAGAKVTLTLTSAEDADGEIYVGSSYECFTDASGVFNFKEIPGGVYTIEIVDADEKLTYTQEDFELKNGYVYTYEIPYYLGGLDYWVFIHDTLLPEMGYAQLNGSMLRENIAAESIIAAQVLDMNGDGVDDMILYTLKNGTVWFTLYTISDGEIVMVNQIESAAFFTNLAHMWIGMMEVGGEQLLYCHSSNDFSSSLSYNHSWYRYGESGLEAAAYVDFYPAAGSRNDHFMAMANSFNGVNLQDGQDVVGINTVREMFGSYPVGKFGEMGLPAPGTVNYGTLGPYTQTSMSSYWGTDALQKSLCVTLESQFLGSDSHGFSQYAYNHMIEDYTPYLEKMAELDK